VKPGPNFNPTTQRCYAQFRKTKEQVFYLAFADERWIGSKPIGHSVAVKRGQIC